MGKYWVIAAAGMWSMLIAVGFSEIWRYEKTAGESASPVVESSRAGRDGMRLLVFAHPHCPCTAASLSELEQVLARTENAVDTTVHFLSPSTFAEGWERTDLWRRAAALPGVSVVADRDGGMTQKFGARTSGQVILLNAEGSVLFRGGLTGARGHEGDNPARQSLLTILAGQSASCESTSVFGCPLFASRTPPTRETCPCNK